MNILLSKKFIFALVVVVMGFALVLTDKMLTDAFVKLVEFIGVTYVIGNGVDKVSDTFENMNFDNVNPPSNEAENPQA